MTLLEEAKDLCNASQMDRLGEMFWRKAQYRLFQEMPTPTMCYSHKLCFEAGFESALETRLIQRLVDRIEELERSNHERGRNELRPDV